MVELQKQTEKEGGRALVDSNEDLSRSDQVSCMLLIYVYIYWYIYIFKYVYIYMYICLNISMKNCCMRLLKWILLALKKHADAILILPLFVAHKNSIEWHYCRKRRSLSLRVDVVYSTDLAIVDWF